MNENHGSAFYIYDDTLRVGIVDSETGPGAFDIVSDEFESGKDGGWKRQAEIPCVTLEQLVALGKAAELMQEWEGILPEKKRVVVTIQSMKGPDGGPQDG
jgi:hypothetical protein